MSELSGVSSDDLAHLEHARALARRGWGRVHPNPLVGCVIVKDDHIVGEGYHEVFGGPHGLQNRFLGAFCASFFRTRF